MQSDLMAAWLDDSLYTSFAQTRDVATNGAVTDFGVDPGGTGRVSALQFRYLVKAEN